MLIKQGFVVTQSNNLNTARLLIKYLDSLRMMLDIRSDISSGPLLESLQGVVTSVIDKEIYGVSGVSGGGGRQTGSLKKSFKAVRTQLGVAVLSDPSDGVQIKAGRFAGRGSYGVFFLKPEEFESFIKAKEPYDPVRYRPFFMPLVRATKAEVEWNVVKSIKSRARRKAPRGKV